MPRKNRAARQEDLKAAKEWLESLDSYTNATYGQPNKRSDSQPEVSEVCHL